MEQQSNHIYEVHSSLAGAQLCCIFTSLSKLCKNAEPKPFSWAKQACFDFSSSDFNVEGLYQAPLGNGGCSKSLQSLVVTTILLLSLAFIALPQFYYSSIQTGFMLYCHKAMY
jgi:hypothetical protein